MGKTLLTLSLLLASCYSFGQNIEFEASSHINDDERSFMKFLGEKGTTFFTAEDLRPSGILKTHKLTISSYGTDKLELQKSQQFPNINTSYSKNGLNYINCLLGNEDILVATTNSNNDGIELRKINAKSLKTNPKAKGLFSLPGSTYDVGLRTGKLKGAKSFFGTVSGVSENGAFLGVCVYILENKKSPQLKTLVIDQEGNVVSEGTLTVNATSEMRSYNMECYVSNSGQIIVMINIPLEKKMDYSVLKPGPNTISFDSKGQMMGVGHLNDQEEIFHRVVGKVIDNKLIVAGYYGTGRLIIDDEKGQGNPAYSKIYGVSSAIMAFGEASEAKLRHSAFSLNTQMYGADRQRFDADASQKKLDKDNTFIPGFLHPLHISKGLENDKYLLTGANNYYKAVLKSGESTPERHHMYEQVFVSAFSSEGMNWSKVLRRQLDERIERDELLTESAYVFNQKIIFPTNTSWLTLGAQNMEKVGSQDGDFTILTLEKERTEFSRYTLPENTASGLPVPASGFYLQNGDLIFFSKKLNSVHSFYVKIKE